jgi:pimeloyl-ACP methyl ester carboxylesterase
MTNKNRLFPRSSPSRTLLAGAGALLVSLGGCGGSNPNARLAASSAAPAASEPAGHPGSYASVNGLRMYYEVHGSGRPVVLMHGAFCTIETDFRKLIPILAKKYQVIAVEQQAHGRTADVDRPLTYEGMADDTAALVRTLGIEKADFVGYSMGGAIGIEVAMRHPNLVRKLVFFGGASYAPEGYYPDVLGFEKDMKPEHLKDTPWKKSYDEIAPNKENFPVLVEKIRTLDTTFPGWKPEAVKAIQAPTLLVLADSDVVRPEHTVEMFRLLGGGVAGDLTGLPASRLAVLPGTTHVSIIDRTDWLASMTTEFLDAPRVAPKAH